MVARLITITFSHYCEKARWALDRRGVAFVEEGHLPILHSRATTRAGGRSTPLLIVDDGSSLVDSTDILHHADIAGTRGERLFPDDDDDARALEERFDTVLGPHARRIGYFFLLDDAPALKQMMATASVPGLERQLAKATLPLMKLLLRRVLKISSAGAVRSRAYVDEIFSEVEHRLADGRRFLGGDRFTAADLTFASLAAPLVMPPAYERWLIPLSSMGPAFRAEVEAWRKRRAGVFALTLFERER